MKKQIFIILSALVLFSSCSFLEEHPSSALTEDEAFATMTLLKNNAVLSVYRYIGGNADSEGLQGTGRGVYDLNSFTTDEQIMPTRGGDWYDGGYWQRLHLHTWESSDRSIRDTWNYLFKVVMLTTKSIERIEAYANADADAATLAEWKAELRALRAMYYFYLVDMYGNVPVITRSDIPADSVTLTARKEVYAFAVRELEEAMPLLRQESSTDALGDYYGRMTSPVAQFVLAKLYLNHAIYTGTEQQALYDSVIVCADRLATAYQLENNLMDNFSLNNEKSRENIFVIPREVGLFTTRYNYFFRSIHYNHAAKLGIGSENGASATLQTLEVFGYKTAKQDPRFDLYFYYDTVRVNGQLVYAEDGKTPLVYHADQVQLDLSGSPYEKTAGARLRKYEHDPNGVHDATVGKNDIVLFRFADVLLMRAEALTRTGRDATAEYNMIRNRVDAPLTTTSPTLEDIYRERWRELMWEGWHRNDMIRFGKWDNETRIFPIPDDLLHMHPQWQE